MGTPATEPIPERIVAVFSGMLGRIDPANGDYWNTTPDSVVYRWELPREGADRHPYWIVSDITESVAEGPLNDAYTRSLLLLVEGVLKADRSETVKPATRGWRLLADMEKSIGINLTMEEDLGNPLTKLAVDTTMGEGNVIVGVPQAPLVTVTRRVTVLYRTRRDDPYTPI